MRYPVAKKDAPRVIDGRNAFIMTSMMQDVVTKGTAARARQLGRQDLAGKTGTTNSQIDAWFAGYNPKQVAIAWIGYDQPRTLGKDETGGRAALPIWMRYMATALSGIPDVPYSVPDGVMQLKIDPLLGIMIGEDDEGEYEYFYHENPPPEVEMILPPMEEPTEADFPESAFPDSMTDNPLQSPSDEPENDTSINRYIEQPARQNKSSNDNANDSASRMLNPSGF
jgi:penicillin-binding protein 1A